MSSNKRKHSGDDGQGQDGNHHKQKRRRSNGRKLASDLDGKSSVKKSQEESKNNDGIPEADTTNLAPEVSAVEGTPHDKRRSRKRDSSPPLESNGASTSARSEVEVDGGVSALDGEVAKVTPEEAEVQAVKSRRRRKRKSRNKDPSSELEVNEADNSIQAEVTMGDGVSTPDGEVAKVTPEEQEAKRQARKEKRRKKKEERDAAKLNQDTSKADQEHKHHQDPDSSGAAEAQKKMEKLPRSIQKEQTKALISSKSNRHSQHKSSRRKESRDENAPTWRVSESTGGCMLRIDPLFSPSEE